MQQEQEGRQMQVVSVFCCPAVEHPAEATPITNIEQGFYFSANSVSYLHMFKRLLDYCITMSIFFFGNSKLVYKVHLQVTESNVQGCTLRVCLVELWILKKLL
jgi:hypothetical protein